MNLPREVKCPSGAILRIRPAPFKVAKGLFQAVTKELGAVQILSSMEVANILKDLVTSCLSSQAIEGWIFECLKSATYDDGRGEAKINEATFEESAARADYIFISLEVVQDNIGPFMKSLSAELPRLSALANLLIVSK